MRCVRCDSSESQRESERRTLLYGKEATERQLRVSTRHLLTGAIALCPFGNWRLRSLVLVPFRYYYNPYLYGTWLPTSIASIALLFSGNQGAVASMLASYHIISSAYFRALADDVPFEQFSLGTGPGSAFWG
jgi:hypothetical protein